MRKNLFQLLLIIIFCLLTMSDLISDVPDPPLNLRAVPVYTINNMKLTWVNNSSNEIGFKIERKTETTVFVEIATVGVDIEEYFDITAMVNTLYTYRIRAYNADGNSIYSNETINAIAVAWPLQNGSHEMLNSWQDGTPGNKWGFHEGIDIQDNGQGGQVLVACRGGVIHRKFTTYQGGLIAVRVLDNMNIVYDRYLHANITTAKTIGETIVPGEIIASISTTQHPLGKRHLHQALLNNWNSTYGVDNDGDGNEFENPFTIFWQDADRDPGSHQPDLEDIDSDGHTVLYKRPDNTYLMDGIYRDVDIVAEAADNMGANPPQGLYKIGYWVMAFQSPGPDIRSAVSPYLLFNYANWFGFDRIGTLRPNFDTIYDPLMEKTFILGASTSSIDKRFHHIVTNTRGTDGSPTNLDASQFWRTDARQGTGIEPNGSDAEHAREIQEAKFPDGKYLVHIVMADIVNPPKDTESSVIVDNSRPYVRRVTIFSGLNIVYNAEWVWNTGIPQLAIQPATFAAAATSNAPPTHDVRIEVEFSEPMQSATITSIMPLAVTPTLTSPQPLDAKKVWSGTISNSDIADDGSDNGTHIITFEGTDLAGNQLLQINNRSSMGVDHHNRDSAGIMQGTSGVDTIHGFIIGESEGSDIPGCPKAFFVNIAPTFPLEDFADIYNPGFSISAGLAHCISSQLTLAALVGFHPFFSSIQNQHFLQTAIRLQYAYWHNRDISAFLRATSGLYRPRFGNIAVGFSLGSGINWNITPKLLLELGIDYHFVNHSEEGFENTKFLTIPLGIVITL